MSVDPYGRRQPGDRRKNLVPQNTRLWAMVQNLAKQKFQKFPSLPASKWMHDEYVKRGGTFVESRRKDTRHDKTGKETKAGREERELEEKKKALNRKKGRKRLKGDKDRDD
jgi:hypothetical protein